MRKNKFNSNAPWPVRIDLRTMHIVFPPEAEAANQRVSKAEMLRQTLQTYSGRQRLWREELNRNNPSWRFLEGIEAHMKMLETRLEALKGR